MVKLMSKYRFSENVEISHMCPTNYSVFFENFFFRIKMENMKE